MTRTALLRTVRMVTAMTTLAIVPPAAAQPTEDQALCIQALDKALAKVAKTQGKAVRKCAKDFAKGKTLPTATVADCTTADSKGKVGKATAKTATDFGKKCGSLPPFGPDSSHVVNESGVRRDLGLVRTLFGADLDAVLVTEASGKPASQCQQELIKGALKCGDAILRGFDACVKSALKSTSPPASGDELRDACLGANGTGDGVPDDKGKIAKACTTAMQEKVYAKKCAGVDTSSLFVPQDAATADATVRCNACNTLNHAATLDRDCDEFDDGVENGSCANDDEITETDCATLTPPPGGVCEVEAGDSRTLVVGDVLAPGRIYRGGQLLVDGDGTLACVGCFCDALAPQATTVRCADAVLSPGLINPHEHITFAQNDPYMDTGERYEHRHQWRLGLGGHTAIPASGGASTAEIRWGELRHLLGGATSMAGAGSASGLVRNLDTSNRQEGLGQDPVELDTFPLGDAGGTMLTSGCGYPSITTEVSIAFEEAYLPHVAEGIDDAAHNEFLCLSSAAGGGQDLVQPQSAFLHGSALTAFELAELAGDATELVWSPRSNVTLYGDTARVTAAATSGVTIALGTDWIVSGSMNLLRELRCADSFNQAYLGTFFSDEELWEMVTRNAAIVTATEDAIGSLETGKVADVAIFDASSSSDHRAVLEADADSVVLVLRGGEALYGDEDVVEALRGAGTCDALDVCGTAKQVCLVPEIGQDLATLQAAVPGIYPAFFCGTPTDEPSCTPMRGTSVNGSTVYTGTPTGLDPDGDGVEVGDICPSVFNPVRPMDAGVQADSDSDGLGDACDPCPNSVACP